MKTDNRIVLARVTFDDGGEVVVDLDGYLALPAERIARVRFLRVDCPVSDAASETT